MSNSARFRIVGTLVRIVAPHFVAGVIMHQDKVVHAAPIVRYMRGWSGLNTRQYCYRKGWQWENCNYVRS